MSELTTIRVSSKGQIVIPQHIRAQMGLEPGDTLVLARHGNALILKKLTLDSLLEESERNFLEGKTLSHEEAFKGLT
jgi:AbrB family looped-hinge helix DNA binding protein